MKIIIYRLGDKSQGEDMVVPKHQDDDVWYAKVETEEGWSIEISQLRPNAIALRAPGSIVVVPCAANAIDIEKG